MRLILLVQTLVPCTRPREQPTYLRKMPVPPQIKVKYFQRKPAHTAFSLERVFQTVRKALAADMSSDVWACRFSSHGILRRLLMLIVILAFWSGPAVAVNFGPPGRVLATLRGWGNGSVAG